MTDYLDLDMRVWCGRDDRPEVTAEEPGSGRAGPEPMAAHQLDAPDFAATLARLRSEPDSADVVTLRNVGARLFRALFVGEVLHLFTGLFDQRVRRNPEVCLRLHLDIADRLPHLAALPWELLHWREIPLATQLQTLFARRLAGLEYGAIRPMELPGKPRVLLVIPAGSGLNSDRERDIVTAALSRNAMPHDTIEGQVTLDRLADTLAGESYHVLHFIGHAAELTADDGALSGYLRLNRPGTTDDEWIEQARIQALFSAHSSLRLVVLNACSSAATSGRGATGGRGFLGLVPALLRAGVSAVLAMQYPIRDDIAIQFADTFYRRLSAGPWAGQIEAATTLARNACYLQYPGELGFATPVLFLRDREGRLFEPAIHIKDDTPMDTADLAREVMLLLLEYLKSSGAAHAHTRGAALYRALDSLAPVHPNWAEALNDLATAPGDEDTQAAARVQLKKMLVRDEGVASEIERLLQADEAVLPALGVQVAASDRAIAAGRDVKITGTLITGDITGNVTIGRGAQGD